MLLGAIHVEAGIIQEYLHALEATRRTCIVQWSELVIAHLRVEIYLGICLLEHSRQLIMVTQSTRFKQVVQQILFAVPRCQSPLRLPLHSKLQRSGFQDTQTYDTVTRTVRAWLILRAIGA